MDIKTFSSKDCKATAYDLKYAPLSFGDAPVHGMLCLIEPGEKSAVHNHVEPEYFYFLSGQGTVYLDNTPVSIKEGQGIQVPAFINHVVENTSQTAPLKFLSFYWEKSATEAEKIKINAPRTLIFSTPPTPNGDLHLGHLSGPYLAADIYRRFLKATGNEGLHVTGRDDHQSYVVSKGLLEQRSPKDVADTYANQVQQTLKAYHIELDDFIIPKDKGDYAKFVQRLFLKLYEQGLIFEKDAPAVFSEKDGRYLHEAFVRGDCPFCHCESDGNACEACGRPNDCVTLDRARALPGSSPVTVGRCKRLYFKMSLFSKALDAYVKSTPMSAHALALCQSLIQDGLPDICVSHVGEWGVEIPVEGYGHQRLYVWFEMAFGYLWAAQRSAPADISDEWEKVKSFYSASGAEVVHFYGFDNTFYHTLLFPAVYFALELTPPRAHVVNELLDLEGSKFSTSRGHLIWGRDLLGVLPLDAIRWVLCEVRPEGKRSNFKLSQLSEAVNAIFFNTLTPWVASLEARIAQDFDGKVPEPGAWSDEQRHFYNRILSLRHQILDAYHVKHFSPRCISASLKVLAEACLHFQTTQLAYLDTQSTFNYLRTALALSAWGLKLFALLAKPIIPNESQTLLNWMAMGDELAMTDTAFVSSATSLDGRYCPRWEHVRSEQILEAMKVQA